MTGSSPAEGSSSRINSGSSTSPRASAIDRKSTRLNSSHLVISYAVFCLKKKKKAIPFPRNGVAAVPIFSHTPKEPHHALVHYLCRRENLQRTTYSLSHLTAPSRR